MGKPVEVYGLWHTEKEVWVCSPSGQVREFMSTEAAQFQKRKFHEPDQLVIKPFGNEYRG